MRFKDYFKTGLGIYLGYEVGKCIVYVVCGTVVDYIEMKKK